MVFSQNGATSIDLVARDLITHSRFQSQTLVIGPDVSEPFEGVDFKPVLASSQAEMNHKYLDILRVESPDIVVVHQYPQTANFIAKKLKGTRVVLHRHGLLRRRKGHLDRFFKALLFRKLDKIVFVSEFIRRQFMEDFPSLSESCWTINNAVDTNFWRANAEKTKTIAFVGRARKDKGVIELIEAFQTLATSEWQLHLVFAVQTDAEKKFAEEIQTRITDDANIRLSMNLKSPEVRDVLADALIATLPSIVHEGFPRAVVEAMSCGCATIATRSGGTPEATGDAALLIEKATPEIIRQALTSLIDDPVNLKVISQQCRDHITNNLEIGVISEAYDDLITNTVKQ